MVSFNLHEHSAGYVECCKHDQIVVDEKCFEFSDYLFGLFLKFAEVRSNNHYKIIVPGVFVVVNTHK